MVLYANIGQKLRRKMLGPMYYKLGVTCLFKDTRYSYTMF